MAHYFVFWGYLSLFDEELYLLFEFVLFSLLNACLVSIWTFTLTLDSWQPISYCLRVYLVFWNLVFVGLYFGPWVYDLLGLFRRNVYYFLCCKIQQPWCVWINLCFSWCNIFLFVRTKNKFDLSTYNWACDIFTYFGFFMLYNQQIQV
jgi:hypothetical protein